MASKSETMVLPVPIVPGDTKAAAELEGVVPTAVYGRCGSPTPPPGHTRICWAAAAGQAARGRPPEPSADNWAIARKLIADGICQCKPSATGVAAGSHRSSFRCSISNP